MGLAGFSNWLLFFHGLIDNKVGWLLEQEIFFDI
jgi:hypothetical protein